MHLTAARTYGRIPADINFTMSHHTYLTARLYFNLGRRTKRGRGNDSLVGSPFGFAFNPLSDRRQNTTRASRVFIIDAMQSDRYCLGCKFFACISIRPDRYSMGGKHHVDLFLPPAPLTPKMPRIDRFRRVSACRTSPNDKCTYLLTTVRLISLAYNNREIKRSRRILSGVW